MVFNPRYYGLPVLLLLSSVVRGVSWEGSRGWLRGEEGSAARARARLRCGASSAIILDTVFPSHLLPLLAQRWCKPQPAKACFVHADAAAYG